MNLIRYTLDQKKMLHLDQIKFLIKPVYFNMLLKQYTLKKDGFSINKGIADPDQKETIYFDIKFLIDDYRTTNVKYLNRYIKRELKSLEWDPRYFQQGNNIEIIDIPENFESENVTHKSNRQINVEVYVHEILPPNKSYTKKQRLETIGYSIMSDNSEKMIDSIKKLRESLVINK